MLSHLFLLWQTEVQFLGKLSHPNVIKLFGYCLKEKKKKFLLVYEFMNNGILAAHLFQGEFHRH